MTMTWEDLAAALAINARTMQRWRKIPDTPELADLAAWRAWRGLSDAKGIVASDAALPGDCNYDTLVRGGKITYALAKVREQVIAEQVENDRKRVELDKARGLLVTRDEAEKAAALVRDGVSRRYDQAITRAVQSLSADIRADVERAIAAALDADE